MTTYFLNRAAAECIDFNSNPKNYEEISIFIEEELIVLLQSSLLCGEYYNVEARNKISEIRSEVRNISKNFKPSDVPDFTDILKAGTGYEEILYLLNNAEEIYLDPYISLSEMVIANLDNYCSGKEPKRIKYSRHSSSTKKQLTDFFSFGYLENVEVFNINLELAYLDEALECNVSSLPRLEEIQGILPKMKKGQFNSQIINLLTDKAHFLEYKIRYRLNLADKTNNGTYHQFPTLESGSSFSGFKEKIIIHYRDLDIKYDDFILEQKNQSADKTKWTLEPIHHLNRYYHKARHLSIKDKKEAIDKLRVEINGPGIYRVFQHMTRSLLKAPIIYYTIHHLAWISTSF